MLALEPSPKVEVPVTTKSAPSVREEVPDVLMFPLIVVTTNPEVEAEPLILRLPLIVVILVIVLAPEPLKVR